jgi:hypothetical protein
MQEITTRQLSKALELITDYRKREIGLHFLVDSLEGIILSLEEQLPKYFYESWYEYWSELEIILALEQESSSYNKIDYELEKLKTFLVDVLKAN